MKQKINYRNLSTVIALKELGYPLPVIRKAMHRLTGITQPDMAIILRTSRINITHIISGARRTRELQQGVANIWGVPREDLFDEPE